MFDNDFEPKKFTHLNFPLPLIHNAHKDLRTVMSNILYVGVYNLSISIYGYVDFEHYEMTLDILDYTFYNPEMSFELAENLYYKYGEKTPAVGLATKIVWDYYQNPKTEFQIMVLCAFCAVRSILGKKRFCKTNNALIIERMFGYCKTNPKPTYTTAIFKKYSKRHHIDKVMKELELSWGLKNYSNHIRGFYLSFKASLPELARHCEQQKKKTKLNQLKVAKQKAKQEALKTISELNNPYDSS